MFKEGTAQWLVSCCLGIARCFHEDNDDDAVQKSISISRTFRPVRTKEQFVEKIVELCEELVGRMEKRNVGGLNFSLVFKSTKFELSSKQVMLNSFIWRKEDLIKHSMQILDQGWPMEPMRLIGVRMSNLKLVSEIRRDKSLNDFFGSKISKEDRKV